LENDKKKRRRRRRERGRGKVEREKRGTKRRAQKKRNYPKAPVHQTIPQLSGPT
jgi:hypothetical protein